MINRQRWHKQFLHSLLTSCCCFFFPSPRAAQPNPSPYLIIYKSQGSPALFTTILPPNSSHTQQLIASSKEASSCHFVVLLAACQIGELYSRLVKMEARDQREMMMSSDEESSVAPGDLRRGPWTVEEDLLLVNYIAAHGEGRWNALARCAGMYASTYC